MGGMEGRNVASSSSSSRAELLAWCRALSYPHVFPLRPQMGGLRSAQHPADAAYWCTRPPNPDFPGPLSLIPISREGSWASRTRVFREAGLQLGSENSPCRLWKNTEVAGDKSLTFLSQAHFLGNFAECLPNSNGWCLDVLPMHDYDFLVFCP